MKLSILLVTKERTVAREPKPDETVEALANRLLPSIFPGETDYTAKIEIRLVKE